MENKILGKLKYSGATIKNTFTDGKIYDCIGIKRGKLRIIDDEGEPFYYSAHNYRHYSGAKGEWIIVEDNSNGQLGQFVRDEGILTEQEEDFEKDKIVASVVMYRGGKDRDKIKDEVYRYVERTPEIDKAEESRLEDIAKIMAQTYKKYLDASKVKKSKD